MTSSQSHVLAQAAPAQDACCTTDSPCLGPCGQQCVEFVWSLAACRCRTSGDCSLDFIVALSWQRHHEDTTFLFKAHSPEESPVSEGTSDPWRLLDAKGKTGVTGTCLGTGS